MSYQLAYDAMLIYDLTAFEAIIQASPDILEESDKDNKTLLHHAAGFGIEEIVEFILASLDDTKRILHIFFQDINDNNVLHHAVIGRKPRIVEMLIAALGPDLAVGAAKVCNKKGKFPLLYAPAHADDPINKILLPITLDCYIQPFNARLDHAEVLKQFPQVTDPRQILNIIWACQAVNDVINAILESYTHPQVNKCTPVERARMKTEIESMRSIRDAELKKIDSSLHAKRIEISDKHARTAKQGNCGECADAVANYLSRYNRRIEVCKIKGDDHVFVIFDGDSKRSNNFNCDSCGPYAVIVDAWSKKVYPAQDAKVILDNLMIYECYEYKYKLTTASTSQTSTVGTGSGSTSTTDATDYGNILAYFNPRYHTLEIRYLLVPPDSLQSTPATVMVPQTFFSSQSKRKKFIPASMKRSSIGKSKLFEERKTKTANCTMLNQVKKFHSF